MSARLQLQTAREAQFRHDAMAVQRIVRTAPYD
ncbi:hypothetical protein QFZ32_002025 [Streptomyces canus]|nr:hypothetical protein [Streptomyces canus]